MWHHTLQTGLFSAEHLKIEMALALKTEAYAPFEVLSNPPIAFKHNLQRWVYILLMCLCEAPGWKLLC